MLLKLTLKKIFTLLNKKPMPFISEIDDSAPLGLQIQFAIQEARRNS